MPTRITERQYLARLAKKRPAVSFIGPYLGMNIKTKHQCKCGNVWLTTPSNLVNGGTRGCGCLNNAHAVCSDKSKLTKKTRTHEEFVARLAAINPTIEVIGSYVRSLVRIKVRCAGCSREWDGFPNVLLQGVGCLVCSKKTENKVVNHEEYVKRLEKTCPQFEVIGTYKNRTTKIMHQCKCCGNRQAIRPRACIIAVGTKCSECRANRASIEAGKHTIPKA